MTDQPQPPDLDAIQTRHHLAVDPAACGTCRRLVTAGKTPEHPQCAHRATLLPAPDAPCWEALLDIPEDQRAALPTRFHTPVWEGNATPNAWLCAVCWGDGWATGWPCEAAVRGGAEVFTPEHQAERAGRDVPALVAEVRRLTAELATMTAVAESNKRYVQSMYQDLRQAQQQTAEGIAKRIEQTPVTVDGGTYPMQTARAADEALAHAAQIARDYPAAVSGA